MFNNLKNAPQIDNDDAINFNHKSHALLLSEPTKKAKSTTY